MFREMRVSSNIKPPCDLVDVLDSSFYLAKFTVQKCVSMIKLDKVPIIEIQFKRLRHLYVFSPLNIRIIKLEGEII